MTTADRTHVLLVEDNPLDARLLREALKDAGAAHLRLCHVTRLSEAMARAGEEHFDVILLDLSLPDAEGIATVVSMHAQAPATPIVVLTGLDDEGIAVSALREGAQDYLVKGQITGSGLLRSIRYATERRHAVDALRQSEEYYRALIENALDITSIIDRDGVIRYGSPSVERVLGYRPEELTGRKALEFVHPDDYGRIRGLAESMPESGVPIEFRCLHKDGSWRVLEATGGNLVERPELSGFVVNSRDVTERKRAEEAFRGVNETLGAVIDVSPLAIYSLDLDGRVQAWNRAAERVFGYSPTEVIGLTIPTVFDEDLPLFLRLLSDVASGQMFSGLTARRKRKDGRSIEVSLWTAPLRDARGSLTGVLVIAADNTERNRLEEQFRQSQKMEAIGRLAGGVAHDFNNILTVITGYCQLLIGRAPASDPFSADLRQVLKAADRATDLTKQLLAFSRRQIVQPKVLDLNAAVMDLETILRRLLGEDVQLILRLSPGIGRVKADPGHVEQVVMNLAVNARDAMPAGGKLVIETMNAQLDQSQGSQFHPAGTGSYVMLAVSDTGHGIPPELVSHVFEPFFTTKEKGRGTGLGLSTSYGIVKQNNGEIRLYSEPNVGTTFKIYLPRVDAPAEPVETQPRPDAGLKGWETILVVEDEEGVRGVIQEMLRQSGYCVLTAQSGVEALDLCKQYGGSMHLLLTDVVMPGMSGRDLADRARNVRPGLKVLYVSGYTDSAIVHHGILDEGTSFLQKPFTMDALTAKVREVLTAC